MISAQTKSGKPINIQQYSRSELRNIRRNEAFLCSECKQALILKVGQIKRPHFAHLNSKVCNHSKGESDYHKEGIRKLALWLAEEGLSSETEKYLPEIQRIPDIYLEIGDRRIIFEYQCARIDSFVLKKRMNDYKEANYVQVWILGGNLLKRIGRNKIILDAYLTNFIHQFKYTSQPVLLFYCPDVDKFAIIDHIYQSNGSRNYVQMSFHARTTLSFLNLFRSNRLNTQSLVQHWNRQKKQFRLQQMKSLRRNRQWREYLYKAHLHESLLPSYIYLPNPYNFLQMSPLWEWQTKFYVEIILKRPHFTIDEIEQNFMKIQKPPLFSISKNPLMFYIEQLLSLNVLSYETDGYFVNQNAEIQYQSTDIGLAEDRKTLNYLFFHSEMT